MPVSMSTVTSVNCTPLVPVDERPSSHSPSTEIGSVPISLHASFQASPFDGLPFTWMRPFSATRSSAVDAELRRDLREQRVERLRRRSTRIAGVTDAAVVLPPDPPLNG